MSSIVLSGNFSVATGDTLYERVLLFPFRFHSIKLRVDEILVHDSLYYAYTLENGFTEFIYSTESNSNDHLLHTRLHHQSESIFAFDLDNVISCK